MEKINLKGIEVYPFASAEQIIDFALRRPGILVAVNIDVIVPFIERLFGFQFLPKDIYLISSLPSDLRWTDVLVIGGSSVILSFLATLYPSWSAAKVNPAEALRYE